MKSNITETTEYNISFLSRLAQKWEFNVIDKF